MPNNSRPPETRAVVAARWAMSKVGRIGTCSTPVPSSMCPVTVAATASAVSGSGSRNPRPTASNTQAESNPWRSMVRAASARSPGSSEAPWALDKPMMAPSRMGGHPSRCSVWSYQSRRFAHRQDIALTTLTTPAPGDGNSSYR